MTEQFLATQANMVFLLFFLPLVLWAVALCFVVWWAEAWGRSFMWALVGGVILTPPFWGAVLLVLGRKLDEEARLDAAETRRRAARAAEAAEIR